MFHDCIIALLTKNVKLLDKKYCLCYHKNVFGLKSIIKLSQGDKSKIMDRRVKRTKTAVFNAVMDLMIEKESSKITVRELCQKADINKSTFYLHYKSIDDCIQSCFDIITNGIIEVSKNINYYQIQKDPTDIISRMMDEVEKNIDYLYKFKSSSICAPSLRMLKQKMTDAICKHNNFTLENNYREVMNITYVIAGCIDVILEPLPTFDKANLSAMLINQLKKAQ